MKKRFISLLVVLSMLLSFASAFATSSEEPLRSIGYVDGGLISQGGGRYKLWGLIEGAAGESLSIRAELKTSSGGSVTSSSNRGTGPSVSTSKTISLSSGTYYVYIYGSTTTHSPTKVISVAI